MVCIISFCCNIRGNTSGKIYGSGGGDGLACWSSRDRVVRPCWRLAAGVGQHAAARSGGESGSRASKAGREGNNLGGRTIRSELILNTSWPSFCGALRRDDTEAISILNLKPRSSVPSRVLSSAYSSRLSGLQTTPRCCSSPPSTPSMVRGQRPATHARFKQPVTRVTRHIPTLTVLVSSSAANNPRPKSQKGNRKGDTAAGGTLGSRRSQMKG